MNRSSVFSLLLVLAPCVLFAQANGRPSDTPQASSGEVSGPVERGLAVFTGKGACLSCHEVGGHGSRLGPNLSDIGAKSTRKAILNSLLEPNAQSSPQYRLYQIITKDRARYTGKLLNQDLLSLQMLDSKGRLLSFKRRDVLESKFFPASPMPSYRNKLSDQELEDLVSFLVSVK